MAIQSHGWPKVLLGWMNRILLMCSGTRARHVYNISIDMGMPTGGLCFVRELDITPDVVEYGQMVTNRYVTQKDALHTAEEMGLYGLGGINTGIIGARGAAA